ncbi:MAG: hypothetical protein ACRDJN_15775 [Chloroflexota bacterium]
MRSLIEQRDSARAALLLACTDVLNLDDDRDPALTAGALAEAYVDIALTAA